MKKRISLRKLSQNDLKDVKGSLQAAYCSYACTMGDMSGGGGGDCSCGCYYSGEPGGSSSSSNSRANIARGLHSVRRA
jgi:hypothetical protein